MKLKSYIKKVLVVFVVTLVLPGMLLFSQSNDAEKPKVIKGAEITMVSGSSVEWKDLKKVQFDPSQRRRLKPIMNFKNPFPLVSPADKNDPVAQTTFRGKAAGLSRDSKALGQPIITFPGMNQSSNGAGWPPDTNGDVGMTYYVQTVNTSIGIYNKSTGALVSATTFDAFFPSAVGAPCDNENNGDPIVLYDQYNQRWFILDFAWSGSNGPSYYSVAASKTSDPTGAWWTYCMQADATLMNDYPKCGVWHDGIYITANMFQFGGSYQHSKIWAVKTPDLYNGTLTAQNVTDSGTFAFSLMPANAKGSTAPSAGAPNYMYAQDASEYGSGHTDAIKVWKYAVDWTTPANTTWTGPSSLTSATYGLVSTGVPQSGSSQALDTLAGRMMYSAIYRKFATHEAVYLCHVAEYSSRRAMRWYEIRISGGNSSIYQSGTYSPDSTHRWMGSICADKNGSIAMGYSAGSSSMFPAIRYCARLATDPINTMGQGEQTMFAGSGSQTNTTRWGDYAMLTIDPADDETFWFTTEYYASSGSNWQTRIGSFKVTSGDPPNGGDLAEGVDDAVNTYTTSGSANWSKDTSVYYNGGDSAKAGTITHSQTTSMETTVNIATAKDLKFYWKVSSESGYDYLRFYIDSTLQDQIAGTVDWTQKTYSLTAGSHTLKWEYYKDGSVSSGSDTGWVDKVEFLDGTPPADALADALDITDLTFTTSGTGDWYSQTTTTYSGGDAAQSPTITHNQTTSMETTITGKTSVKFWWKVSSESGYDFLRFYIDGTLKDEIAGTVDWEQKAYTVTSGSHTLKWTYYKDGSVSSGSDTGWVDKLELGTGTGGDALGAAVDAASQSFALSGDADWYVTTADYQYGTSSVSVPAALNHNQSATMETTISGVTQVKFFWKVSSETNYDFLKFYIDGVLQDEISGTVAWQQKTYTVTTASHTLKWIYDKDASVSSGSDTGWVDHLEL